MDQLGKRDTKVAFDSVILIYYFEDIKPVSDNIENIFYDIEIGKRMGLISTIAIHEILIKPIQRNDLHLIARYKDELLSFPNLYILPITFEVAEMAARLRARYRGLRAPDALQIATAYEAGADIFLTADKQLKQIKEIKVKII